MEVYVAYVSRTKMNPCLILCFNDVNNFTGYETTSQEHLDVLFESMYLSLVILMMFYLGGIHKLRLQEEGGRWSKRLIFCKPLYHRKCKRRGVGGQKKPNLVNVNAP